MSEMELRGFETMSEQCPKSWQLAAVAVMQLWLPVQQQQQQQSLGGATHCRRGLMSSGGSCADATCDGDDPLGRLAAAVVAYRHKEGGACINTCVCDALVGHVLLIGCVFGVLQD